MKEESEKVGLKINIQKTKIMASEPLTSWQIDGKAIETVTDFILGGSKTTSDGDCSHEIKRRLLLGSKVITNLDRCYFASKVGLSSQSYGFSSSHIWMWAECQRIDAFELWCWRRVLRVPWTARRSNQSMLKEINPGISLEGMMLKLKLQYFGHLMWRVDSLEKTLMLGGTGGRRRRGNRGWDNWMASPTQWTWVCVDSDSWWWIGRPGVLRFMESQRVRHNWVTELNWWHLIIKL